MTKTDILDFLKEKKVFLKQQFSIDRIVLFRSYARDEATNKSDIDLAIKTSKKSFSNRYKLKTYLFKRRSGGRVNYPIPSILSV